ncbi:MAG: YggS family pyridoxal phosphate-dependent enzyme [Planctomycetota bacterium]|jgi:pyridoxal phosphate enzyme (YggS family)
MKSKLAERVNKVQDTIAASCARVGRAAVEVKLVVVTKAAELDQIKEVISLGIVDLGENRVQRLKKVSAQVEEFLNENSKDSKVPQNINWHMVGHLQRNKVRQVLPIASLIHSVDTLRLAEELNSAAEKINTSTKVLLQVNTSEEPQKYGVPVGAAIHLAEQIQTMPKVQLIGLMTMAPLTRNKDIIRSCFARSQELFLELKGEKIVGPNFTELSMGMSSDYQAAVEHGATILRIGSAIFAG